MVEYLKGVLEDLPKVITGRRTIPSYNNLFQVRPENEQTILNEERETALQHMVENMLFVTSRYRKDINTNIALLCT